MKITFLGTGTSLGVPIVGCNCEVCRSTDFKDKRLRSSVYLEIEDKHIVIDMSPDFRQQCLINHITHIDAILVTHPHRDHIGGLDDIRPFCFIQKQIIPVYGSTFTCNALKHDFSYCFDVPKYPGAPDIQLFEIDNNPFEVCGITITPITVMHAKMEVTAFRINNFTYITDANKISDESMSKIYGTEYLVVNALGLIPHKSHFTLAQALDFIKIINPKHAYITHTSHALGYQQTQKDLPPNVTMAYDGLSFSI